MSLNAFLFAFDAYLAMPSIDISTLPNARTVGDLLSDFCTVLPPSLGLTKDAIREYTARVMQFPDDTLETVLAFTPRLVYVEQWWAALIRSQPLGTRDRCITIFERAVRAHSNAIAGSLVDRPCLLDNDLDVVRVLAACITARNVPCLEHVLPRVSAEHVRQFVTTSSITEYYIGIINNPQYFIHRTTLTSHSTVTHPYTGIVRVRNVADVSRVCRVFTDEMNVHIEVTKNVTKTPLYEIIANEHGSSVMLRLVLERWLPSAPTAAAREELLDDLMCNAILHVRYALLKLLREFRPVQLSTREYATSFSPSRLGLLDMDMPDVYPHSVHAHVYE